MKTSRTLGGQPPAFAAREIPNPPRFDYWPTALRSAEMLSGSLVPCGPGVRGVGWPETPRVRLAALAPWLVDGRVAAYLTAAWVWGATREPGRPLRVSTRNRVRHNQVGTDECWVHELRFDPTDVVELGPFATTSPLRTAHDLLYHTEAFSVTSRAAVRLLLYSVADGKLRLQDHLNTHRRPGRAEARRRFSQL